MGNCVAPPTHRKIEAPAQKTAPKFEVKTAPVLRAPPTEGEPFRNLFKSFREEEEAAPKALAPLSINNLLKAGTADRSARLDLREKRNASTEADSEINRLRESTDDENRTAKSRGKTAKTQYHERVV
jgi:hypothetical protein